MSLDMVTRRHQQRLHIAWQRLSAAERRLLVEQAGLVPGAVYVDPSDMDAEQRARLVRAMRAVVSLADECRFALAYGRNSARGRKESG